MFARPTPVWDRAPEEGGHRAIGWFPQVIAAEAAGDDETQGESAEDNGWWC